MKKKDILIAILVSFVWGSNFVAVKFTVIEIPGILSIALRLLLTALFLAPFVKKTQITFSQLYQAAMIFGVFYLGLLYYGLYLGLNTSLTIILMQLNIPISIIIAKFVFKEHLTRRVVIGIVLAFLGMLLVAGTPHLTGNAFAVVIVLFSAFFCALFNIQNRQLKSVPPLTLLFWNSLISAPHLLMLSYFIEGNPLALMRDTTYILWIAILYSVIVAGILGISLWIYLLQNYPVYQVMPFNLLVPFFGVSLSILLLGELPSWHIIGGGAITLLGIAVTQVRYTR